MKDFYLNDETDKNKSGVFEFKHSKGTIRHEFIKQEIPVQIKGEPYFDLATPFLYGGPAIIDCHENDKWDLVYEFTEVFGAYCRQNNIVCEHVCFNPVQSNVVDFLECYEVEYVGDTFGTNLSNFANPVSEEFSLSCQKAIWRALEAGVEYRVAEDQSSLQHFNDFFHTYFGDRERFEMNSILENPAAVGNQEVVVEARHKGQIIGMSLNYSNENVLHTYLSASLPAFDFLSPVHVMRFGLTLWGKENGFSLIHDGGMLVHQGIADVTSFKQQFAKHTSFKFCTGRKIWNEEAYHKLCAVAGIGTGADAFPAYRAKAAGEITDAFM